MMHHLIRFFLENRVITWLLLILVVGCGLMTSPFNWDLSGFPRDPVAVDAIPDIGENQQIVFSEWPGRSPQDIEDQITYPLTSILLGIPGVKSVRSNSMFGLSSIYLIFDDDIDFYWSRSRILEKLNALPPNILPTDVKPSLGPDATGLGQIYWYTLEGRDSEGNPTGGWNPEELRSIQDFYVKYALSASQGISEVSSIGGFVKEYRVDIDPEGLKSKGISLQQVINAIRESNLDVGAQTLEINSAEYFVRGLGYIKSVQDIEESVVTLKGNQPIRIRDIAKVYVGPATRRGLLDKSGAEAVGGVVVARYGSNPMEVINSLKAKIDEISPGLPTKTLVDGTQSQVTIVPFYDRTQLIKETIGTLEEALTLEILITIIVVLLMLFNLQASVLVAITLPVSVLICFIAMRYLGVDANIVALSGIAIAIGTMVDMSIVITESIFERLERKQSKEKLFSSVLKGTTAVAPAVITAIATTIISFLPVFAMEGAEGKLFKPLAYTKTFALIAAILVSLIFIPPLSHAILSIKNRPGIRKRMINLSVIILALVAYFLTHISLILIIPVIAALGLLQEFISTQYPTFRNASSILLSILYALGVVIFLTNIWMPLGVDKSTFQNIIFIALFIAVLVGTFWLVIHYYTSILRFLLQFKILFLACVIGLIYFGFTIWKNTGEEFMPSLDEGSFLLMPTSMPHSGIEENKKNLRILDMAVTAIPEVETVVGKAGRAESALDPAPLSMYENIILYKSEYRSDEDGQRIRYKYEDNEYVRDEKGNLIIDKNGRYFRQWRDHIKSPDDIWNEIVLATSLPGVTSAPKLQPIETRLVMLQTGMRAPMGIKVKGPDLKTIERTGLDIEKYLLEVEGVKKSAVFAERIVGKPYLIIDINRAKIARYGLSIVSVQRQIQAIIGGMSLTTTVEGRERYQVRIRYPMDYRGDIDAIKSIYIETPNAGPITLGEFVEIRYEQGPQSIKSEDGFLVGYVLFDKEDNFAEVEVVENANTYLEEKIRAGELQIPPSVNYHFSGNYLQQVRASKRLAIVVPIALVLIFIILYLQFRSVAIALMVFSGVFVAFAGGFIMLGLYNTSWFFDFSLLGVNFRDLFQIQSINLSVAVWVGFLALFGIATDDGVLVATYLKESFNKSNPKTIPEIRDAVVEGGLRRIRPAMMTTATTLLALLPILTSTGRGADIMIPMAIPSFGGMVFQIITMFTVPILFSIWKELKLKMRQS